MMRLHPGALIAQRLHHANVRASLRAIGLVLGVGAAMAAWSWNVWADPVVDFGREAYVAWRLSCGDQLYQDVAYFNGPLSPAVNAAAMKLAGPTPAVLYTLNAAILAVIVVLLNRLVTHVTDRRCGVVCAVVFLGWFAFGLYTHVRGFNYVAPYSHEMTHGIALSLWGLYLLKCWSQAPRWGLAAGAGIVLGLLFLTKPEIFMAAVVAYAAVLCLAAPPERCSLSRRIQAGVLVGVCGAAVWAAALVLLKRSLSWDDAWEHSLGAWPHVVNAKIHDMHFYRWVLGLDDPPFRIATLVFWLSLQTLALRAGLRGAFSQPANGEAPVAPADAAHPIPTRARRPLRSAKLDWAMLALAAAIGLYYTEAPRYANALAPTPIWLLTIVVVAFLARARTQDAAQRQTLAFGLVWTVFSLALLAKTPLNVNIFHYGFVLAMPATMALIAAFWLAAKEVQRRGGSASRFAAPMIVLWVIVGGIHLVKMSQVVRYYGQAPIVAANAKGPRTHADEQRVFNAMLAEIAQRSRADQTLAVWPQGALVNVLAQRKNSTPYIVLLPPEFAMFGEDAIVEAYAASPPDFVLLVHCDTRFYGQGWFGDGYARDLRDWLDRNYTRVAQAGAEPFVSADFGMVLLERRQGGLPRTASQRLSKQSALAAVAQ